MYILADSPSHSFDLVCVCRDVLFRFPCSFSQEYLFLTISYQTSNVKLTMRVPATVLSTEPFSALSLTYNYNPSGPLNLSFYQ